MLWTADTTVRYAQWIVRWRWLVIIGTLLLSALAVSGGRFLVFSSNYRMFFDQNNPQLQAFESIQAIYTRNDNVFFTLRPHDGKVFTPTVLKAVQELTEASWRIPYSIRVDSITNFQHTHADGDDLTVEDLVSDPEALSAEDLGRIRSIAVSEPLLVDRLISKDGSTTGVNVTVHLPGKAIDEISKTMVYVRELAEDLRSKHPDITVAITGVVALSNAFPEASLGDIRRLVPLMYILIVLTMLVFLRSVSGTFATISLIALAAGSAMGLAGWIGIQLSPPAANASTIIVTLAVADSIHILVSMLREMGRGLDKREALVESLRINMQPVFLTSLTTIVGFLSLNFSEVPPIRDCGNITAMGIATAWLYSITFLPALMAVLPVRARSVKSSSGTFGMDRLAEFVIRRRRGLLWGMTVMTLALVTFIPRTEINEQFVDYFDERIPFRVDTDFTTEHLTGIYQIHFSLGAGGGGGVNEPAYFARVQAFEDWFRKQPGVLHISTITDVMKRLNKNMHGDDPDWYRLPDNRQLAAQYLLLYEMSLPYGLDLNNQINVDKSATRFTVTVDSLSTREFRDLKERAEAWLVENTPASMHAEGTGTTVMFSYLTHRNMKSMLRGTSVALVLICLCLCLAFKSLRMGLLSMVPNIVPPVVTFGVWAILVGRAGHASSFVTAIALGIIVDDTVHFLSKYLRARREQGLDAADAVRYAFSTVGLALCITTGILVAGFSVLAQSSFEMNATMGLLAAIMIAAALFVDFLLFAPLLIVIERRNGDEHTSMPAKAA